jgi:hypothetical protein
MQALGHPGHALRLLKGLNWCSGQSAPMRPRCVCVCVGGWGGGQALRQAGHAWKLFISQVPG